MGTSEVVVTYIDTITRSEFNMTYPLTILDTGTYYHYVALGVITETEATTVDIGGGAAAGVDAAGGGAVDGGAAGG